MGMTRARLAAVSVAVLALVGTACEPSKPQMELELGISATGTFEVLTERITLNMTLACTRPTEVTLRALALATSAGHGTVLAALVDESGQPLPVITCRGPGYATNHRTVWRDPSGTVVLDPLTVTMVATTTGGSSTPLVDRAYTSATQRVTLTRILCWPLPTTCATV